MINDFFSNTKYRHWLFGLLLACLSVFGLVSIVYEEWTVSSDNIINNLAVENIALYLHFPQPVVADKNWQKVPADIKTNLFLSWPDFFSQEKLLASLSAQEYAYVIFNSDNKNDFGWLVYWPQQTLPALADNLTAATSGNLLIISHQAEEIKNKYFNQEQVTDSLLTKVWPGFFRPSSAPYAYVDFNKLPPDYNKFNLANDWRLIITEDYIEVVSLVKSNMTDNDNKNKQWLDSFYGEDRLFYNLKANELTWLWQQNNLEIWHKNLNDLQSLTGINISEELKNLGGYYNLVVSQDTLSEKNIPTWLVSLPAEKKVTDLINQAVARVLGYLNPRLKETILPDKSIIKEYIITDQTADYQIYNLSGQEVKIIYFNSDDYIFYTRLNNDYIIGNSLKLLNRLITKAKGEVKRNICQNEPEASYSFKIDQKLYSISAWHNKKQPIYRICY